MSWPRKSCCSSSESSLEALDHGRQHGVEPVLRRLGVEVDLGEAVHVGLGVDRERGEPGLDLVEQVRVGRLGEQRRLVVRLEGGLDRVRLVGEVEHHGALLLGRQRAVEPRERLHRVHAAELLVHVHRVQQRLVEAGLELVGDDQEAILRPLEGLRGLRLREAVHPGLGVGLAAVLDRSREGHEGLERIAPLLEVPVHGELVAHGMQARARHDHRLGPAADLVLHLGGEVLHHDPDLLVDGVRVQLDEGLEQVLGLALVVARVGLDLSSAAASRPCRWCSSPRTSRMKPSSIA